MKWQVDIVSVGLTILLVLVGCGGSKPTGGEDEVVIRTPSSLEAEGYFRIYEPPDFRKILADVDFFLGPRISRFNRIHIYLWPDDLSIEATKIKDLRFLEQTTRSSRIRTFFAEAKVLILQGREVFKGRLILEATDGGNHPGDVDEFQMSAFSDELLVAQIPSTSLSFDSITIFYP